MRHRIFRSYFFSIVLLSSVILGGLSGIIGGPLVTKLKPIGELFLNLIFTTIVPLVFFSIASACSRMHSLKKYTSIFTAMMGSFLITGAIAAIVTLIIVKLIPIGQNFDIPMLSTQPIANVNLLNKLIGLFSVSHFSQLFSHTHMMALIVFALLVGAASSKACDQQSVFIAFLQEGEAVFMRVFSLIMYLAPVGFFAYFASLINDIGPNVFVNYAHVTLIYYGIALTFFIVVYTGYAYWSGKKTAVKLFWSNILLPATTALATCSSAAAIPANLAATKAMQVPKEISDLTIPFGTITHKEGSIIGGMIKIAFLFGLYHLDFSGTSTLLTAIGVAMLVGTVMGAIPSGGMLGELLILSVYGFPPSALMLISVISILIDPIATLLNTTGNTINCLLITKMLKPSK